LYPHPSLVGLYAMSVLWSESFGGGDGVEGEDDGVSGVDVDVEEDESVEAALKLLIWQKDNDGDFLLASNNVVVLEIAVHRMILVLRDILCGCLCAVFGYT